MNLTTYIHVLLLDDCSTNDDFLENIYSLRSKFVDNNRSVLFSTSTFDCALQTINTSYVLHIHCYIPLLRAPLLTGVVKF